MTPGWRFVHIGFEGDLIDLDGLNPWPLKWKSMDVPPIEVPHPSYPQQRHRMYVSEISEGGKTVRFAAGEFSNGVWGFYLPDEDLKLRQ